MKGLKLATVLVVVIATMAFVIPMESVVAPDTDDRVNEVGVEWVVNWPNRGWPRLQWADDNAHGFYWWLMFALGWTGRFDWGDNNAWDSDFEQFDDSWADNVDFVYVVTHGNDGVFFFDNLNHNNGQATPGEINDGNALGNLDLEWMSIYSCRVLRSWWQWIPVFDGLHQIQSFSSQTWDNPWFGWLYASLMTRWAWFPFWAFTTNVAWHIAAWMIFGPFGPLAPFRVTTFVLGADNTFLRTNTRNDHLWDQGWVSPDPVNPNSFWFWSFTF